MTYAFLNTRLASRSKRLIDLRTFLTLLHSPDEQAILQLLAYYGIKSASLKRTEADIALENSLFSEASNLLSMVSYVPSLKSFLSRFRLNRVINLLSYFKAGKLTEKGALLDLYQDRLTKDFITESATGGFSASLFRFFGFRINQNIDFYQLPAILLSSYYKQVLFKGRSSSIILGIIKKESLLQSKAYNIGPSVMSNALSDNQISAVLGNDQNLFDLKILHFLYKTAQKTEYSEPLSEAALIAYSYGLELSYKFARALYFKMQGWIRMEVSEGEWKA